MNSIIENLPENVVYSKEIEKLVEQLQQGYAEIVNRINTLNYSSGQPTHAAFTGVAGEIYVDTNYVFFCVATNTWKRCQIVSW